MGKTIMGAIVSLDGYMADDNDGVGPLFDWLGNGPVSWSFDGSDDNTAPFTFVNGVAEAIAAAQEFAGDRVVDVGAGQIGGQALALGLIDQIVVNLVPVVFGSGRPFFATGPSGDPILLDNPSQVVQGDRVTHLLYDVEKS